MLGTLSPRPRHDDRPDDTPRQFIFADGHGGVEKIRIDLEAPHLEHVRDALDTNPDASRVAVSGAPGGAALRAPDEPAPLGAVADQRTEAARRAVRARNGAGYVAPLPAVDAELLDDEDLDLFDDLDDVPVEGGHPDGNGNGNGSGRGRCAAPGRRPGTPGGREVTSGLPVLGVLAAAVLVALARSLRARRAALRSDRARERRPADRHRPDRGSVLIGTPAFAQSIECKESPEPDRPGTGLVGSLDPPTPERG